MDQVSSAIILIIAALYLFEASNLPIWKGTTLGPGLFPLILGIALVAVNAHVLLKATASKGNVMVPPRAGAITLILIIGSLIAYTLLLEFLGFILSTFAFLAVLFIALEPTKKWKSFALAGAVVAVIYALFVLVLRMQVPRGLL